MVFLKFDIVICIMVFFVIIEEFDFRFFLKNFSDIDSDGQSLFFLFFNMVLIMVLKSLFFDFSVFLYGFYYIII